MSQDIFSITNYQSAFQLAVALNLVPPALKGASDAILSGIQKRIEFHSQARDHAERKMRELEKPAIEAFEKSGDPKAFGDTLNQEKHAAVTEEMVKNAKKAEAGYSNLFAAIRISFEEMRFKRGLEFLFYGAAVVALIGLGLTTYWPTPNIEAGAQLALEFVLRLFSLLVYVPVSIAVYFNLRKLISE